MDHRRLLLPDGPVGDPAEVPRRMAADRRCGVDQPGRLHDDRRPHQDLIKTGGEWISSVELENTIMSNPVVTEAAVVAVPDEKWDERPFVLGRRGRRGAGRRS